MCFRRAFGEDEVRVYRLLEWFGAQCRKLISTLRGLFGGAWLVLALCLALAWPEPSGVLEKRCFLANVLCLPIRLSMYAVSEAQEKPSGFLVFELVFRIGVYHASVLLFETARRIQDASQQTAALQCNSKAK